MKKSIWRFTLRGLLLFMTFVAVVAALAAHYPLVALLITISAVWVLIESGAMMRLARPALYTRHPFLVASASLLIAVFTLGFSGLICVLWLRQPTTWMVWIPILLFGGCGIYSLRTLWLMLRHSSKVHRPNHSAKMRQLDERPI